MTKEFRLVKDYDLITWRMLIIDDYFFSSIRSGDLILALRYPWPQLGFVKEESYYEYISTIIENFRA